MKKSNTRLLIVLILIFCVSIALLMRLFYLQIIIKDKFIKLAEKQQTNLVKTDHERGLILDKNQLVLASNVPTFSIYADPKSINDKAKVTSVLSEILDLKPVDILKKLRKDKSFVWIKRKVSRDEKKAIDKENLRGVGYLREYKRFYPQENLAANILGIVNIDNQGIEGIELSYDKLLQAHSGEALVVRDSKGKNLPLYRELKLGSDGYNLELTIDAHIQYWADEFLRSAVEEAKAKGGSVIVMNPDDGRVLAMANNPSYNSNKAGESPISSYRNRAVCDYYEPGSVFKVITLVAALDEVRNVEKKIFDCENGAYKVPGTILHDWKAFGKLRFDEVFMNSSNIGVAKLVQMIGPKKFSNYIYKFGLGELTGIDLPSETPGYVKPYKSWSRTSPYIIPMGQEVAVSLLQMTSVFATIANGGHIVRPFVVDTVVDSKGVVIKDVKAEKKGPVIAAKTARKAREVLGRVVSHGTGRRARVKGVNIAGKTGTAQKINPQGGYSKSNYYVSFIGFFPVEDPKYVIGVTIDEPHGKYKSGGMVAAPLFQKIAEKITDYAHLRKQVKEI